MSGESIRTFFRELFGSRLTSHMEAEILQLRADCEMRLRDKDEVITALRAEKAALDMKVIEYERALMPLQSKAGQAVVTGNTKPTMPAWAKDPAAFVSQLPKSKWEVYQENYYAEQERLDKEERAKATAAGETNG